MSPEAAAREQIDAQLLACGWTVQNYKEGDFTDECDRSIYGLGRQVLEYFDAHLVGLTATPGKPTVGSFEPVWNT